MIEITPEIKAKLDAKKNAFDEGKRIKALPTFRCLYRKHKVKSATIPEKCPRCELENLRVTV